MSVALNLRTNYSTPASGDLYAVSRDGQNVGYTTYAQLMTSPAMTGNPTATTQSTGNSSTRVATTAYVKNNLANYARLDTANTFLSGQKIGDGVGQTNLVITGGAGELRTVTYMTGASGLRAITGLKSDAEGGSDTGSTFFIGTVVDTPVGIDYAIEVKRDTAEAIVFRRPIDILGGGPLMITNTQVLTDRQTGWSAATGTLSRAALDGSSATLAQTREALAALITDLTTHGLIGA